MQKAFLETNAINRFLDEKINGKEVRAILSCHGYSPVIGLHVVYELAQTFLSGNSDDTARNLFEVVRDLDPDISEAPEVVLKSEYTKYLHGTEVACFLCGDREAETRQEIIKLSNGTFDDNARNFISTRHECFSKDHPVTGQANVRAFLDEPPNEKLRSFEDVSKYYENRIPELIEQILKGIASPSQALDMAGKLNNFPLLKSTVMANLYLIFIAIVHKNTPATDKVDDHRHIIEASYCDVFVTEEKQLLSNARKINSSLRPMKWSTMATMNS